MSEEAVVHLTCCCGARLDYSGFTHRATDAMQAFNAAHEMCRKALALPQSFLPASLTPMRVSGRTQTAEPVEGSGSA